VALQLIGTLCAAQISIRAFASIPRGPTADALDYAAFKRILGEALHLWPTQLFAHCLMLNHWHLVLRPKEVASCKSGRAGWRSHKRTACTKPPQRRHWARCYPGFLAAWPLPV